MGTGRFCCCFVFGLSFRMCFTVCLFVCLFFVVVFSVIQLLENCQSRLQPVSRHGVSAALETGPLRHRGSRAHSANETVEVRERGSTHVNTRRVRPG